ncbi:MAG TPA: carboxypeptidase regulatory-like domain-containing protein, partial [Terriglobales bacterium]|nr:carboxypeptidase regulatory-like domain-containing protein [Terriglobales bacterium]
MQASTGLLRKSTFGALLKLLMIIGVALMLAPALLGQAYFGTVSGELTDATGAVVTGAKVVLVDQQKGFHFETTSDNSGRYLFRSIPPGAYVVTAQASGFGTTQSAGFKVDVNQNATANLILKPAATTQTVTVEAAAQAIQTEDAETGQVVNRRFINDLPLIDRNIESLTSLAPGVTEMDDQCPEPCLGTNFVSNGSRGAQADILLDGASVTNSEPNGGITSVTYLPSPEAVEEFKVEQTNFSAEYGFSGASVVNVIGRSGTNKFHGSGYEFLRDASLDANDWFANRAGNPIPPLRRNNFGGTIGGPIIKNKTFFFFDYDYTRQTGLSNASGAVPSNAMRAGDFGEVCAAQGGAFDSSGLCSVPAGQIWDPYSGTFNGTITR